MIEVMPALLSEREFPNLMHSKQLTPGFRQSPVAEQGVAICFARATPAAGATEEAVAMGVAAWQVVCRAMLRVHGGYECKEPDPGKFTLVGCCTFTPGFTPGFTPD